MRRTGGVEVGDKAKLKAFIEFLKDRVGFTFELDNFDHRIKLQKYVFLARAFGWNHDYGYNLYIRGPYSSSLAKDYYNLEGIIPALVIPGLDGESFRSLVLNKDTSWLEVAATLIAIHKNFSWHFNVDVLEKKVISRTFELKSNISEDIICDAYKELKRNGFLDRAT